MPKQEVIYDKTFHMSIESEMYDEIRKRAHEQKRSLAQIARTMFEKCIEREDEIERDINKDIEEIKKTQKLQIEFQEFMKEWVESLDKRNNPTIKETI